PPSRQNALRVGLEVRAARHQIEIGHVGTVPVEQDDFLEAVVGERFGDVEHVVDEMLEMIVNRSWKIHDVARVAITNGGQHEQFVRYQASSAQGDSRGANDVDIQWQMSAVLFHGATGDEANLPQLDGVIDFRQSELLIAEFSGGAAHGWCGWQDHRSKP